MRPTSMAAAAAVAPTHDRLKMVTVSTPTAASSSASDDQLMALVSRACSNVDRWNAIHTEQSGIQARMRVGPSANAARAGVRPETCSNHTFASGV